LNKIALIRAIINWVVNFITDYIAPWIIENLVRLLFNANSAIFSAISWSEQVNFQWDDDEVRFVLDQHT
jgi:stringent starvation protein B